MKARRLHVHIDELVLHGFAAAERFAIADALEAALGEALAPQLGALVAHGAHEYVDAGTVRLGQAAPAHVGAQVAAQVARGLGSGSGSGSGSGNGGGASGRGGGR